jgi:hypothetical protein
MEAICKGSIVLIYPKDGTTRGSKPIDANALIHENNSIW